MLARLTTAQVTRSVTGCIPTRSMGTISVLETCDRSYALRGNASQDAPRPAVE